ncbi:ABC transporter ATP-binding protein [Acuticoccus sp. 2012]|uniref:ABC transporter ATP-binding protein n=1 Tax=Acuticoccus mangrovi TaxID=2796142 RepID=A0A934IS64_9HYPH|nr:ABC transporter ATP-binding protein [Acuticoccus mangrovi]
MALDRLTKRFGRTTAVNEVTLTIEAGEFFVVLGPSGCGKSTLLRLIAGLEEADEGTISLSGEGVSGPGRHVPPEARSVAVVFQSYALWPHMSVRENVAFPVASARLPRSEAAEIVEGALEAVALTPFATRKPAALSGGQQQRVALARCLASRARTVLMDEPLANLDPHLRYQMEAELARVHAASGATTLYITHDQREAMALASRIAVMDGGRILQVDTPRALYERPMSETVARFIGRGAMIDGAVKEIAGGRAAVAVAGEVVIAAAAPGVTAGAGRLFVRPHQVVLGEGPFEGRVERVTYRGGLFEVSLTAPGIGPVEAESRVPPGAALVRFGIADGWVMA